MMGHVRPPRGHPRLEPMTDTLFTNDFCPRMMYDSMGRCNSTIWTKEEDEILRLRYLSQGASGLQRVLGRTAHAISTRAQRLGLRRNTKRKWTPTELEILRVRYPTEGASKSLQASLNRGKNAIAAQARLQGLTLVQGTLSAIHRAIAQRGKDNPYFRGHEDMRAHFVSLIRKDAERRDIPHPLLDGSEASNRYLWELYVTQEKRCALSDQPIGFTQNTAQGKERGCASLDRIDSSKGYIEGNVQWVHKHINVMKRSISQEEFIQLANQIAKKHPRP